MKSRSAAMTVAIKEARALAPAWVATMGTIAAAMAAASLLSGNNEIEGMLVRRVGLGAFALGALVLGSMIVGHEYIHRSLGQVLTLPFSRARLFAIKLAVLVAALAPLAIAATVLLRLNDIAVARAVASGWIVPRASATPLWNSPDILIMGLAFAICVAPWLTMAARNPLAGVVFSIAIPAMAVVFGDLIGAAIYGAGAGALIDAFAQRLFRLTIVALCVIGAASSWWMFLRLESIDGRGQQLDFDGWQRRTAASIGAGRTSRHPLLQLAAKELRLQQLSFVVAGLYAILGVGVLIADRLDPEFVVPSFVPVAMMFAGVLSMVIGAVASAEERQLGTLESQLLLPAPAWQQWMVKIICCLLLALALGVGVTMVLGALLGRFSTHPQYYRDLIMTPSIVLGLTLLSVSIATVSLYVSSLCRSSLRAIVLALPAVVIGFAVIAPIARALSSSRMPAADIAIALVAFVGLVALVLFFAERNHRSLTHRPPVIVTQIAVLLIAAIAVDVLMFLRR